MSKPHQILLLLLLALACLVSARGLFTTQLLAGHDSPAYPVSLQQFDANIREGVLFPRWAGDMRYGYGHPKLQFRPPALHYLAELPYALTGQPFLALNAALILLVFAAGFGMYLFARTLLRPAFALLSAAGYVTFNYYLANIYLRGAYYEVAAYAFMPWVLLAQAELARERSTFNVQRSTLNIIGTLAWVGLLCGHPATATFFVPLAAAHVAWSRVQGPRSKAATPAHPFSRSPILLSALMFACGILISAPYTYVASREVPWVRMQIFWTGIDSYHRNFISIRQLLNESWPVNYDAAREVRSLNWWACAALFLAPLTWFAGQRTTDHGPQTTDPRLRAESMFYFTAALATLALCLPISRGLWDMAGFLHTFNFPWRVLGVTSMCVAMLLGLTIQWGSARFDPGGRRAGLVVWVVWVLLVLSSWPHTAGWPGKSWMKLSDITTDAVRRHAGIHSQFYTPTWVRKYAERQAQEPVRVIAGNAQAELLTRDVTRWRLRISAQEPSRIVLEHYYYPGWRVHGIEDKVVEAEPWGDMGLISFPVPAGQHEIEVRLVSTPARAQGNGMALAGVVLMAGTALGLRRASRRR